MIKRHKKAPVIAAMAFTTLLSQAAWANEEETTLSAPVFQADELSAAFEQSAEPMQMLALSEQEMKDTEGAAWPIWAGGAAIGGLGYTGSTVGRSYDGTFGGTYNNFRNNWSNTDFGFAVAAGAVGGAYGQALFRGVGYNTFRTQAAAPLLTQVPIRSGSVGLGFATFGVHGYPTTSFNNGLTPNFGSYCGSCYRGR